MDLSNGSYVIHRALQPDGTAISTFIWRSAMSSETGLILRKAFDTAG